MNFQTATNYDIIAVSRKDELETVKSKIEDLQEYGLLYDKFAEEQSCEAILNNEPLSLEDVETFSWYSNRLFVSNQNDFKHYWELWEHEMTFNDFKYKMLDDGDIHQLQYEAYKEL